MAGLPSSLSRHQIRRTRDSFYECISVAIYGNTQRARYIRSALWDAFSLQCFGCDVSTLTEFVTSSSETGCIPQGPFHAWEFSGALAWMTYILLADQDVDSTTEFQILFSNINNQRALAQYVIRSSMHHDLPDVRVVGQTLCDCFNVGLVAFSADDPSGRPLTFGPKNQVTETPLVKVPESCMIHIHMIKDGPYWDLLMHQKGDVKCVPKHVVYSLVEERMEDLDMRALVLSKPPNSLYQIKLFDGKKRTNSHVGHMIGPKPPNRVHHLEVDATNVKDWWLFVLYKEKSGPTQQFSDKDIWIFARTGDRAYWISVWKKDLTAPTFLLNVNETAIYVVKADDKETAAACVRKEFSLEVHLTLPLE